MFTTIRNRYFPAQLADGITVQTAALETIRPVWDTLSPQIFTDLADVGAYRMPAARRPRNQHLRDNFAQRHTEYFIFYNENGAPIGWSNGEMLDAETYFMTWSGILPAYQNRGLYQQFLHHLLPYLHTVGYERVASKHMVNNRPVLIAKLKAGFHVTGVELDERWGAQVSLVYYFYEDRHLGFATAFSLEPFTASPLYISSAT